MFELVKRFLGAIPGEAQVPDELVYATHSARVRVEGDCSILDEIRNRMSERRTRGGDPEQPLKKLLETIAADAIKCRTGLMWGEIAIELDYGGGRRLRIVATGCLSRQCSRLRLHVGSGSFL
ncbi:hypothetical protein PABY_11170 [Pyrodictium abyssi]|uniref:Uncharacterized protein n=1 Tax=Pyrodictium abyssi TaxID=54256 RepID=A0ABM8IZE7_9CREN|nr:hypothetical protein PABY_11170 [Pyrodictium abyssi]